MGEHHRPSLFPPASSALQRFDLTPAQLDLVWDMNRGLTRREFDNFIETSKALGLNPLKRQICAIVFGAGRGHDRNVAVITTIAGLRALADRTGTYRPDTRPARFTFDEAAKHPRANPLGIVDCIVTPYRHAHGRWHRIAGQVWWDEIAPISRDSDGEPYLDSRTPWPNRPRGQIIKCAEAAALRAGWPEGMANVYAEDEVDRARLSMAPPSNVADEARAERLQGQTRPKGTILIDLHDGNGLKAVPVGEFHDRVSEVIQRYGADKHQDLLAWRDRQRISFREFFGHDRSAAIDLKQQFERIEAGQGRGIGHGA